MGYFKALTTMYAEAWLEKNNMEWSEENWSKAIEWAYSHSPKECIDYLKKDLL